jgi:hypothetical protein
MDLQVAVVLDETQFSEFVHELADTRPRRSDDFRQCLLADFHGDWLWTAFLAEIRQEQQRGRQALFARIENLVGQVLLRAAGAGQQMSDEPLAEARLVVQDTDHLGFSDPHDFAFDHGSGRRQAERLPDQAALPEELARAQDGGYRFLALREGDHDLDLARLDVEDGIRRALLREDDVVGAIGGNAPAATYGREKRVRIEDVLGQDALILGRHGGIT